LVVLQLEIKKNKDKQRNMIRILIEKIIAVL
jgi:hypothetical protein